MDWNTLLCADRLRSLQEPNDRPKLEAHKSREEFDRDYDRAIFSTPVRRLQDKTQVFPLDPNDSVRTRLTHSLEVSTLTRGLARRICSELVDRSQLDQRHCRSIESIAATCALIHDIGNPPFGHAGEQSIAQWFRENEEQLGGLNTQQKLDFTNFEGNAQTIRIVTKLQVLADFHGLNLTVGCLSAALKYTAASHQTSKYLATSSRTVKKDVASNEKTTERPELKKAGYFYSETDIVGLVRKKTGTGEFRNPIAYIVEACDDIVYATVDVEDGVKKGILSWAELAGLLRDSCPGDEPSKKSVTEAIKWVDDYVSKSNSTNVSDDARAQLLRTKVISESVAALAASFVENNARILAGEFETSLLESSSAFGLIEAFKRVGQQRVYVAPAILRLELMGRKVIHDLLGTFWDGASRATQGMLPKPRDYPGKAFALLSMNYRLVFERALQSGDLPIRYAQAQLITDYVCGMTDTFALNLRNQIYGIG